MSCNDDTQDDDKQNFSLLTNPESIICAPTGEVVMVEVESNGIWTAVSNADWCNVDKNIEFDNNSFKVTIDPNTDFYSREAKITVKVGTGNIFKVIPVFQPAENYELPTTLNVGMAPVEQKLFIEAKSTWNVSKLEVNGAGKDWVNLSPESGTGINVVIVTVDINNTGAERSMILSFNIDGQTKNVTVIQEGILDNPVATLLDDENKLSVSWDAVSGAEAYNIEAYDNYDQLIASDIVDNTILTYDISKLPQFIAGHENFFSGLITIKIRALTGVETVFTLSDPTTQVHSHYDINSGDGTSEATAFIVSKPRHLNNVRQNLNGYFKQTSDIDLANFDNDENPANGNFIPIDNFNGTYDGLKAVDENYKISNLVIKRATVINGLFGRVLASGVLKNILLSNPVIECTNATTANQTGALAGNIATNGNIENCHTEGGSITGSGNNIGGLIGTVGLVTNIYNCSNKSTTVNGAKTATTVGGLIGYVNNTGVIENCYNAANVNAYGAIGGLNGGHNSNAIVRYCYNTGTINNLDTSSDNGGTAANIMSGGLSPRIYANSGKMEFCYNAGEVKGAYYVGGLTAKLGSNTATIENCYNTGKILITENITGSTCVGGITGTISLNTDGSLSSTVRNCYSVGTIELAAGVSLTNRMGGVIGAKNANNAITDNVNVSGIYFLNTMITPNAIGERPDMFTNAPKSDTELKKQTTYAGWDFATVWTIDENTSYPTFKPYVRP